MSLSKLTPRELEITKLIAEGLTSREIGKQLYITKDTVNIHARHILTKTGISSRQKLAAFYWRSKYEII